MRELREIIVHCSFTRPDQDIGVQEIRRWHLERGFNDIGYHYVIRKNGRLEIGRDIRKPGAHTKGHNDFSIGICLIGGMGWDSEALDDYSEEQLLTLRHTINALMTIGNLKLSGHRDYTNRKTCPNFNVREWYNS